MRQRAILAALFAVVCGRAEALSSVSVVGRVSHDSGNLFVSEPASGTGGGVGLRASFGGPDVRWEPEVGMDVAGYTGEGDGDPIVQAALLVSRRAYFGRGDTRPWWSLGAGAGAIRIAGVATVVPLRAALGISFGTRGSVGLDASVFNRYTLAFPSGDADTKHINAAGVELAVRFGRQ